jgi:hypothetical protein
MKKSDKQDGFRYLYYLHCLYERSPMKKCDRFGSTYSQSNNATFNDRSFNYPVINTHKHSKQSSPNRVGVGHAMAGLLQHKPISNPLSFGRVGQGDVGGREGGAEGNNQCSFYGHGDVDRGVAADVTLALQLCRLIRVPVATDVFTSSVARWFFSNPPDLVWKSARIHRSELIKLGVVFWCVFLADWPFLRSGQGKIFFFLQNILHFFLQERVITNLLFAYGDSKTDRILPKTKISLSTMANRHWQCRDSGDSNILCSKRQQSRKDSGLEGQP